MKNNKSNFNSLKSLIYSHKAKVGIFGLGYVGLPLALRFIKKKYTVYGFDSNVKKIKKLNFGKSYIKNITNKEIKKNINKILYVNSDFQNVSLCDILIFCLPTPLNKNKTPDLSFLKKNINSIKNFIRKGQLFSNESTSYPGTTEEFFLKLFEEKKLKVGEDVFLAFSPEREDPGNKYYNISNITKVISGHTKKCLRLTKILYNNIVNKTFIVNNIKTAEMTKLIENTFRAINIGFINEMKIVCEKMGIDIWEVVDAAKTKPFGFFPFTPGPGIGGHCIPVDPHYLVWKAKKYDSKIEFIKLAARINDYMPTYVAKIAYDELKNKKNKKILIMGVAYKPDVDDYRESPSIKIIEILKDKYNCKIDYNDPYVPKIKIGKNTFNNKNLNYQMLKKYDAVMILTNHTVYNKDLILKNSKKIIDTRGSFKKKSYKIINA